MKYLATRRDNGYVIMCMSLMLLSCTFKMVKMGQFYFIYILPPKKQKTKNYREGGREEGKKEETE